MNDFFLFLGKFLRHGTKIASLAPSSPWLSRATVRNIDWSTTKTVIELGAGTGPITKVLAELAPADCRVIAMERDADFAKILRERFAHLPNFTIIEGDACELKSILGGLGIEQVDAVVSGLPIPSFPKELQQSLFKSIHEVLKPNGSFSQITELPLVYWRFYKKFFDDVKFAFEPRNFPPAGAYYCRGLKEIPLVQ